MLAVLVRVTVVIMPVVVMIMLVIAMIVIVSVLVVAMVVMPVVIVTVAVVIIMRMRCVRAAFRFERRFDGRDLAANPCNQAGERGIFPQAQPVRQELHGHMAIP